MYHYSREEIEQIAKATTGQTKNPTWRALRYARLSANLFQPIYLTANNLKRKHNLELTEEYIKKWRKAIFHYDKDPSGIHKLEYGIKSEQKGIQQYEINTGNKVIPTGLWLFPDVPMYAAPDGMVCSADGKVEGVIEVKCPSTLESETTNSGLRSLGYLDNGGRLNQNSRYFHQVQGHLYATQAKWCDFIIWAPDFYQRERIKPNEYWVKEQLPLIKDLLCTRLLPELKDDY